MKKINKLIKKGFPYNVINNIIDVLNNTIDFVNKIVSDEFKTEIVEVLPEIGDINKLYLVKSETIEETNYYDEYLWIDNKWEKIGNTKIASINKHLLVYEDNKIKENGVELTFSVIYAILTNTEDFVALVYNNHKFYVTHISDNTISFTSNYLDNGQISAERVNITSENVVTYTVGTGLTKDKRGNLNIGQNNSSYGNHGLVNGLWCITRKDYSHAEGTHCHADAGTSHAEGYYCNTGDNGGSAHAEGSYTNANGPASHTEGYRTITTEGGQHAQGCWNKSEGGVYSFMHGCGTSAEDLRNAFLIAGDEIYIYGVGGYDGTNYGEEGVKSLRQVLTSIQDKLVNF